MKMSTKIKTYDAVTEIVDGSMLDKTKTDFQKFHTKADSHKPVQFCWNDKVDKFNAKTSAVTSETLMREAHYYCMRSFNANYKHPTDGLLFKVVNKKGRPTQLANFYNYLFSAKSPWRGAFANLVFVGKDKHGIPDSIVWFDTSIGDAKLTINLFSTIRLHTCWGLDAVWQKMVDAGFDPETAMLMATNFSFAGQTITISNGPAGLFDEDVFDKLSLSKHGCSKTDMPFSTNYNPSGFKPLLVDKKPMTTSGPLASGVPPQPNNFIWHQDGIEINADNLSKTSAEYKESKIKVVQKDALGLVAYLSGKTKTFSKGTISEITDKLVKNELLEV